MLMMSKTIAVPLGYILKIGKISIPCETQTHVFTLKKQCPDH